MNINTKIINDYNITTGANKKQYCPNPEHHDNNPGSFSWFLPNDSDMPIGHCFSCGYSITLEKFLAERDNLTDEQARQLVKNKTTFKRNRTKHYIKRTSNDYGTNIIKQSSRNKLSLIETDYCYSIALQFCRLSFKGAKYLKSRGLSNDEIKKYGFVDTFNKKEFNNHMYERRNKKKFINKFKNVAGFYIDYDEQVMFNFPSNSIIIPITDHINIEPETLYDGSVYESIMLIKGLQYRSMDENANVRYMWISSTNEKNGTSAIAYHGLMSKRSSDLFITEGFFKARFLDDNTSADVAYVQGIRNTSTLLNWLKNRKKFENDETIERFTSDEIYTETLEAVNNDCVDYYSELLNKLNGRIAKDYQRVFVAYDMDIWDTKEKEQVLWDLVKNLKALKLRVFIITWDKNIGKGIDDIKDITLVNTKEV